VVLAALAAKIPINLGTALTVQYFRNPVDAADSIAAISEMMDASELSIGLARGNPFTPNLVDTPKPVSMLRETAQSLHGLLAGEAVTFRDYPTLASYFNLNPAASFRLNFEPKTPIRLYCGGNQPLGLAVGGEFMDGLIFGGEFKAVAATGRLPSLLQTFDDAASRAGKEGSLPKVAQIKLSLSRDQRAAREFAKPTAGRRILGLRRLGYTPEDILKIGVSPADVDRLEIADREGASPQQFNELVTDAMIDAIFVAGDPAYCRERMLEVRKTAQDHGFQQLKFSELGPDVNESMHLLCEEIIPAL
jgi:alkanesulfonate monooxygenase SsuD/methylene tetrahydromethanopterin reductase-like flavin-dependent oxidoreductase (luciferase family)